MGAAYVAGPAVSLAHGQAKSPGGRPEPADWFSGDPHVHRGICCGRAHAKAMLTPQELLEKMEANNLSVISVLADIGNGECKYVEKDLPLITGRDNNVSTSSHIVHWDAEWHYDPEGVTFQRKVLGGHLVLLGLKHGGLPFAQYTYPILKWAKEQGGIGGYAHMQYLPYAFYPPPDGIPQSLDCCTPLEYPVEVALGMASFVEEDVRGGGSALEGYYRLLNCGLRPGLAGATDYPCNYLEPLGTTLTYVRIPDGQLTYQKWIEGIAGGRTVVSRNGGNEFLALKVNDNAEPGEQLLLKRNGVVPVRIEWSSVKPGLGRIELVRDGSVIASQTASAGPGAPAVFNTTVEFERSGWLAARRMDWQTGHRTATGAVFVIVDSKPIRANAGDARFFVAWIDNLLQKTSRGGPWSEYLTKDRAPAHQRYREARAIYLRIAAEAEKQAAEDG